MERQFEETVEGTSSCIDGCNSGRSQNYKALLSTTVAGDGVYAEYTYNGDKQELYEDVYGKLTNRCIKEM